MNQPRVPKTRAVAKGEDVKASEVLAKTREVLMKKKWVNRVPNFVDETCLVDAFFTTLTATKAEGEHSHQLASQSLVDAIGTNRLTEWNDARTFNEVIEAVDDAILLAKERESA